jgi:ubiquinone/menaquinone biosynthesis C-methylase UbiE
MKTDREWEKWGKRDPYYGVVTHEKFRRHNITDEAKNEFFDSGRKHISHVLDVCRRHFGHDFTPNKVLDFGCGTGRLIIPFAEIAEHVVGLDVSDSMLEEALKNCNRNSVKNVTLLKSDDNLSRLEGRFDFIHSFIVFQHIPVERGKRIFEKLLTRLEYEGICVIQFTYSKTVFRGNWGLPQGVLIRKSLKTLKRLIKNTFFTEALSQDPEMQMNPYHLNELFFIIQSKGVENLHLEFTDHGGELGVFLYFQKSKQA